MRAVFLPINEAEQKYQNLSQLFSRSITVYLAINFHLQPGKAPT
jgi:hypothetical protein